MTVHARPAIELISTANIGLVDMRTTGPVVAGTYTYDGPDLVTGWHSHDLHQIEYALRGIADVETRTARYLLPPRQAVWIPAGLEHQTTLRGVHSVSVFFDPVLVPDVGSRARILAVPPVVREMILHAERWPIGRAVDDAVAQSFFEALSKVVVEVLDHEAPLWLPTSSHPVVAEALGYTNAHLDDVSVGAVCEAVGVSERTLRRLFDTHLEMTWRQYVRQSRILRSMVLLAEPGATVLDVATAVGFESGSAFTRTFRRSTGETPADYRRRVVA